jgi:hypothetical protein
MPASLTPEEKEVLRLLIQHAGLQQSGHYATLRKAGVPEQVAKIYNSDSEFLDSLVNRKMQILRAKGWIEMKNSVYKVFRDA